MTPRRKTPRLVPEGWPPGRPPRRPRAKKEPFPARFLWPRRGKHKWLVELGWEVIDGRAECVRLRIVPVNEADEGELIEAYPRVDASFVDAVLDDPPPSEPLTTSLLRELPFGRLIEEGRKEHRDAQEILEWAGLRHTPKQRAAWEPGAPGRPPEWGPEHFEKVAQTYARAWQAGKHPTKAVAARWKVESSTAAKWVARARALGFLGPTSRGRAGGVSQVPDRKKPTARKRRTR